MTPADTATDTPTETADVTIRSAIEDVLDDEADRCEDATHAERWRGGDLDVVVCEGNDG